MGLLFNIYGVSQANVAANMAQTASAQSQAASDRVRLLENRVERLALACQAMWELLREKTGLPEEAVIEQIRIVDERDGHLDGRMNPKPVECPACHRTTSGARLYCMYCGAQVPCTDIFA